MRPTPPEKLIDNLAQARFVPSPELGGWVNEVLLMEQSGLYNQDHAHLEFADIAYLWTNAKNTRQGNVVVGQAEIPGPPSVGGKWARGRYFQQIEEWFGRMPDFIITVDAMFADAATDLQFCALIDHELYHCGQAKDEFGGPKFKRDSGEPVFTMRGHDVEEFVGVVKRYGVGAGKMAELVEAGNSIPTIGNLDVAKACGNCHLAAA